MGCEVIHAIRMYLFNIYACWHAGKVYPRRGEVSRLITLPMTSCLYIDIDVDTYQREHSWISFISASIDTYLFVHPAPEGLVRFTPGGGEVSRLITLPKTSCLYHNIHIDTYCK